MMMIHHHHNHNHQHQQHPTVEIPPPLEAVYEEAIFSPQTSEYFSALKRYLPSSSDESESESSSCCYDSFTCDNFRMYEFKIRKCGRGRSHDWTDCPYAHPGEKARRRDPRKFHYSAAACPEFRRGSCRKGDSCEFSHGVFECWLHPARYRTQPCKDGPHCSRRVCFFAHSPDQLRVLSDVDPPSPRSPPLSPTELASAMMGLQLQAAHRNNVWSPRSCSPRGGGYMGGLSCNGGMSLPTTPTRSGCGGLDPWEIHEEVTMERVESGKHLRAKIYAKLGKDNSLAFHPDPVECVPDFQWVSELLQ